MTTSAAAQTAVNRRFAMTAPRAVGAVVVAGLLLAGCDAILPKRSAGEKLWRERCASCHALNASGNTPLYMGNVKADLTDDLWEHGGDPGDWGRVIREGVFGRMPGNPDLSREQVKALVDYLRQLRGEKVHSSGG